MENTIEILNDIYKPVYEYLKCLLKALKELNYDYEWKFCNNHSIRKDNQWILEYYPIPLVTVKDICDIGIDINHIFIECKMKKEKIIGFEWKLISDYNFDVYGVEDYLNDFYNSSLKLDDITERIIHSNENEIGIEFQLRFLEEKSIILELIKKLEFMGTFIL
ncbi:hypothetical protein GCM10023142_37950 [Anaerocolumna aminovalerica]|uniref:Uncharacterized protein n=1 Tax=Anaerocolumna aminovalerica TaxID=1527 RepID=A0A1I5CYP4_9FIRM|nr:DUF3201 domain-containing protein [Anaerocolumna aminovalerica]MDU6264358.1 DUF3201 domain-containing protein [Anaerocolumna aminovalerica]SFN92043.1 Protein of unknown function [Anaerocolumna aminovalerica]